MTDTETDRPRRTCATMPHHFYLADTDSVYRENRRAIETDTKAGRMATRMGVIRIPVVVHVLHLTETDNIDQYQIDSQIAALNRDYRLLNPDKSQIPAPVGVFAADALVEFALAVRDPRGNPTSGITRTWTSKRAFPFDPFDPLATEKLDAMIKFGQFGKAAWPRDSYLNIWTCTISGGLLGYAQFPGGPAATDGVVINNTAFGSDGIAEAPYDLGRTGVHEVGHWTCCTSGATTAAAAVALTETYAPSPSAQRVDLRPLSEAGSMDSSTSHGRGASRRLTRGAASHNSPGRFRRRSGVLTSSLPVHAGDRSTEAPWAVASRGADERRDVGGRHAPTQLRVRPASRPQRLGPHPRARRR
jgi:hypothetical protein